MKTILGKAPAIFNGHQPPLAVNPYGEQQRPIMKFVVFPQIGYSPHALENLILSSSVPVGKLSRTRLALILIITSPTKPGKVDVQLEIDHKWYVNRWQQWMFLGGVRLVWQGDKFLVQFTQAQWYVVVDSLQSNCSSSES